jgi:hypothetical protein
MCVFYVLYVVSIDMLVITVVYTHLLITQNVLNLFLRMIIFIILPGTTDTLYYTANNNNTQYRYKWSIGKQYTHHKTYHTYLVDFFRSILLFGPGDILLVSRSVLQSIPTAGEFIVCTNVTHSMVVVTCTDNSHYHTHNDSCSSLLTTVRYVSLPNGTVFIIPNIRYAKYFQLSASHSKQVGGMWSEMQLAPFAVTVPPNIFHRNNTVIRCRQDPNKYYLLYNEALFAFNDTAAVLRYGYQPRNAVYFEKPVMSFLNLLPQGEVLY